MGTRITLYRHPSGLSFYEYNPMAGRPVQSELADGYEERLGMFGARMIGAIGQPNKEMTLDDAVTRGVLKLVATK